MVRGNTRRGKGRRPTRNLRNRNGNLGRMVSRIQKQEPYRTRCPADPPPYIPGIRITKTIHFRLVGTGATASNAKLYGDATQPGRIILGTQDKDVAALFLDRWDIMSAVGAQWFGVTTPPTNTLDYLCVHKVCAWGSADSSKTGIAAALLPPNPTYSLSGGDKVSNIVDGTPVPMVCDEPSGMNRARVSLTIPVPQWWRPSLQAEATQDKLVSIDVRLNAAGKSGDCGHLSILVSIVCGEVELS